MWCHTYRKTLWPFPSPLAIIFQRGNDYENSQILTSSTKMSWKLLSSIKWANRLICTAPLYVRILFNMYLTLARTLFLVRWKNRSWEKPDDIAKRKWTALDINNYLWILIQKDVWMSPKTKLWNVDEMTFYRNGLIVSTLRTGSLSNFTLFPHKRSKL